MDLGPSARQRELIALARHLARERFAPARRRATTATRPFPSTTMPISAPAGLLGLCVPDRYGGLGADYETYCLVAEQLAQGNASTALTFNMHCLTMLMMGADRRRHADASRRARAPREAPRRQVPRGRRGRRLLRAAPQRAGRAGRDRYRARHGRPALRHHRAKGGRAATWSTGGSSSSPSRAAPPTSPPPRSGSATSPGSSARSTSRFPRTRRACPSPASGIRWGCAARSAATWCSRTCSSPTTARCCRRASFGAMYNAFPQLSSSPSPRPSSGSCKRPTTAPSPT